MRLKSLEIKGFKSFANDTVIHFGDDIVGIVGPNGSGKSNIVDAIRWVLGEQKSRELRLDTMSSVIFNGTKKRKPGGLASVSLTFDNTKNLLPTEYQEVKVTRMLYRSGESEYRLNGVPCRLKDITNLFLDTGVGSNSYAIIALGMVDDILADKENARRRMFEQAAGISKYKQRKKETLSKLKSTSADLERIEDLLYEIEGNLASLEKQAKRAKKYFDLKDQYKQLSLLLADKKSAALKDQHKTIQKQLDTEQDKFRNFDIQINQLEADLEKERKANLDKEKALSDRQRELNALVGQIRGMENDKRMAEQRIQFIESNRRKTASETQSAQQRIEQLQREIENYRQRLNEEKRLEASLEDELDAAEKAMKDIEKSHSELKSDLDAVMSGQQKVERELFELEKQKAVNVNQMRSLEVDLERQAHDAQRRQVELNALRERLEKLEKEETDQQKALKQLEGEEEKRRQRLKEKEWELEALTKEVQKINRQLDAKKNEYKLTQSMVENLEGFPESIRFLSNKKNWKRDAPLLSDLIYVEEDFRVAIENYLEPFLNYYVVQNIAEAFEAIELLNKTQKGKANFFLLDAFTDYQSPMTLLPDTRQAIDLVQVDVKYRPLVSHLLENVLVTENEEMARKDVDENVVVLSRTGQFVRRKYSVGGGSVGLFEGKKIGRKKNLEILEAAIKKLEKQADKLTSQQYNLQSEIEALRAEDNRKKIQQAKDALHRLLQEKTGVQARFESLTDNLESQNRQQTDAREKIEALRTENEAIEARLTEKLKAVQAAKEQISQTDGSYRKVAEALSAASARFNQKNIEFIRQQNMVSTLQRELAFRERQLDETRAALDLNQKNLSESETELETVKAELERLEKALIEAYEVKKEKAGHLSEAEQQYFKARGGINEIEDQIRRINKNRMDAQMLINNLKDKLTGVQFQLQSIAERLRIEFSVHINELDAVMKSVRENLTDKWLDESETEIQIKVERLKNRLDNYGEINPMAVEAYDEMKARYDNITTQRDDIVKAKEDLIETIKEIEETATTRFLEAFEKTRLYFIDVFRSLFSEDDNADLILLDPENPLESKIEIVAKPKGKRPQSISQLSGGEKTLTATALLFALYLLKPAPFCIFDEVDAPLDDANIEKFNKIIKKFSANSQFIIVTHNKQTMAAVDTIYGVFMQEQGVSAVAAVNFQDLDHNPVLEKVA
ncbi:MAG: chromosome segregation protein SMC [Bacteroidetes bacterium]|nr:MAG: chromosome segregation protein SMC [Bacteroidota bacterium]